MRGNARVETEYMGKRKHFRNSYFASFQQIVTRLGRRSGIASIAVAVLAMNLSSSSFALRVRPVPAGQRQKSFIESRAADLKLRKFQIQLQQLPQHRFRLRRL